MKDWINAELLELDINMTEHHRRGDHKYGYRYRQCSTPTPIPTPTLPPEDYLS